jgi:glycosyltransferase involved in cell wall biosynthesis
VARLLASPCALGAQILRRRAAVVHINTSLNFRAYWRDCVYMLTAKLCGARVLCQVHGGMIAQFLAGSRFKRWAVRATLALPDAVVVLSTTQREACRSLVPQQIVLAIPNGVDAQRYAPRVRTALDRRGPLKLLYVGRLTREKGLYETIEALSLERLLTVPVELIVAGSGEEEAGLRAFAASHRLERKVTFTGPVFGDDKIALLSAADAFVLPSYSEGLPYALLEAMASGLPAIVTAMGAIPDVMTPGVHGLFVGPRDPVAIADAVLRLSADRALLAAMSAACRQRIVESYTVERVAGEFEALYGRLCSGRRLRVVAR